MSGLFITAIIFFIIAVVAAVIWRLAPTPEDRKQAIDDYRAKHHSTSGAPEDFPARGIALIATGVLILIGVVLTVFASFTVVPTRDIGVTTTFGKPVGTLSNGLHMKAPWQKVEILKGSIQIDTHDGEGATQVRLGNNSIAHADNTVQWRIRQEAADSLFKDYKTFDNIKENLVEKQTVAALNDVLGGYNPVEEIRSMESGNRNQELAAEVKAKLVNLVGDRIEIINVMVPVIKYDEATQKQIETVNTELANTNAAKQRELTAQAEANANKTLAESVRGNPEVVAQQCMNKAIAKGISPAGCWPGDTITGIK